MSGDGINIIVHGSTAPAVAPNSAHETDENALPDMAFLKLASALDLGSIEMQQPDNSKKVQTILKALINEYGDKDAGRMIWNLKQMELKLAPSSQRSRLDTLYQYSQLLLDKALVEAQIGKVTRDSSGSRSSTVNMMLGSQRKYPSPKGSRTSGQRFLKG